MKTGAKPVDKTMKTQAQTVAKQWKTRQIHENKLDQDTNQWNNKANIIDKTIDKPKGQQQRGKENNRKKNKDKQ